LGEDAYRFVDWLKSAGQTYWQVLPLGEIGPGNSPYMSNSAFAGNVLLIDLSELAKHGWLDQDDLEPLPEFRADRIDFALTQPFRMERLRRAAKRFSLLTMGCSRNMKSFVMIKTTGLGLRAVHGNRRTSQPSGMESLADWPGSPRRAGVKQGKSEYADEMGFWKFWPMAFWRTSGPLERIR